MPVSFASRLFSSSDSEPGPCGDGPEISIGGQALMEGVMMRYGDRLALAVRRPAGDIVAECKPWFTIQRRGLLKKPWINGFMVLIETLVNGVKALNRSATFAAETKDGESGDLKPWQLMLTMVAAIAFAIGLFVVLPHLFSVFMQWLGVSGGVEGLSFHFWDGAFKFCIFLGYVSAISLLPDIRRVFQYHGAEHKVIHTYEGQGVVSPAAAALTSRLHPRCGTTFLLFVLSIAILMHVLLLPLLLVVWTPQNAVYKHAVVITLKLLLMAPISALAYEAIRLGARLDDNFFGKIMLAPGLLLQMLTTREPDRKQIEVALVSLCEALKSGNEHEQVEVITPPYTVLK